MSFDYDSDTDIVQVVTLTKKQLKNIIIQAVDLALKRQGKVQVGDDELLSARAVAKVLGTRRTNIDQAIKRGELKHIRIGERVKVSVADARDWYHTYM